MDLPFEFSIFVAGLVIFFTLLCKFLKNKEVLMDQLVPFFVRKKDFDGKRHGGELVIQALKDHGVTHLFTLSGGHISPVLVAAESAGIRVVDTRHEVSAVFAADAYARLSGKIGVAVVTAGPGVTNAITAVKNAQMAESPVLLLGGAAATLLKDCGSVYDIEQISLFQSVCKYAVSVPSVRQIIPTLRTAIQIAKSGTPGPVFVQLPLDVLYPYDIVVKEVMAKREGEGFVANLVNLYDRWHLHKVFVNSFVPKDSTPLPTSSPLATKHQIQECKKLVENAKKPVIIVGSQAVVPASSVNTVRKAVSSLGIPCFLSGMARGLLGRNNDVLMLQKRSDGLKEADLIILAGAVCDFRLRYGTILNRKAKIIAVNLSLNQLNKNAGTFWNPTIGVHGSVSDFLIRLRTAIDVIQCDYHWVRLLQKIDLEEEELNKKMAQEIPKQHLNPIATLFDLEELLDENTILIVDGGDFVATASYILRPRGPLRWLDSGPFGTLGCGAGFALGAKCCCPDANVVIIYGDGSVGYSIMEFDTFFRHKLPVAAIVGNDACWTQIKREQVRMFKNDVACKLQFSDYHAVAQALGAEGFCLDDKDQPNVKEVLKTALELPKTGKSVLVNVLIGKSDFSSSSLSVQ